MNSRLRVQSYIEQEVGCVELEKWKSYNGQFKQYSVTPQNLNSLRNLLSDDTADLYFKAILSIAEAIDSLRKGFHSWAVVKLYYSIFYLLKCSLAARGLCFVKNSGIYTLKLSPGETPVKRDGGMRDGEAVRGDHKTVIATYIKEVGIGDFFLSNHIDGEIVVFDWLMKMREDVNYRNRTFYEPEEFIFDAELFKAANLGGKISEYFSNSAYCFLKEHCCLATPLWLARRTARELTNLFSESPFTQPKSGVILSLVKDLSIEQNPNFKEIMFL